ncbi:MAG: hypothetical protein E6R03_07335 [Hyphomicrobiaceae bacterium]|nr:MAG: hypothetical protein E6R03_07335 [Hyphomicrobiaceae bacterium]
MFPFIRDSGPFLNLLPFPTAGSGFVTVTNGTVSISGTQITLPATSSGSLVGAVYGVEFGIGVSAGYVWSENVAGAASSQTITIDISTYGGTTSSTVNARTYYNLDPLDDPATRVYSPMLVPLVNSASLSGTTTEGQTLTGANGVIVGGYQMTLSQSWSACNTAGTSCTPISGQTATTLVLSASEVGDTIKYIKTATNTAGSGLATSNASAVVAAGSSPVVFDAVSTASQVSATSISWTHTPSGTPTKVFACIGHFDNTDTITSVTYGGNAMTLVGSVANPSSEVASIYSLASPPSGAQTVTVNMSASALINARGISFTGGDASTAIRGTGTTNSGTSTAAQVTQASATDDLVLAFCVADDNTTTLTPAGTETQRGTNFSAFTIFSAATFTDAGAASVSMDVTLSTFRQWGIVACSVKS